MKENNQEKEELPKDVAVADTQTTSYSFRDTKEIVLRNVPIETFIRYRDYCRNYANGNWTRGLQMMLDIAEIQPTLNLLAGKIAEIDRVIDEMKSKTDETADQPKEEQRKKPKTFGGI